MFERLKRALVESFMGAIALGYLLAQCILHFVNIFASPIAGWVSRNDYRAIVPGGAALLTQGCTPRVGQVRCALLGLASSDALALFHAR
jgi:hypothetical protein